MVKVLRVKPHATNEEIQDVLSKIFSGRDAETEFNSESDQFKSKTQDSVHLIQSESESAVQSDGPEPTAQLSVMRSTVKLDAQLREEIKTVLSTEYPYSELLHELESQSEVTRGSEKFRLRNSLLVRHMSGSVRDSESFWRIVVPDDQNIKNTIMTEIHSVPYAGHPGFQRTLQKVRQNFYWKGMTGDVQSFVLTCPVCQMEKAEHTLMRGQL